MCLIVFAINNHHEYPFILAANRDEFYERPTERAQFWKENGDILGGKDLKAGGTWMGITRSGRFAAVTNFRDLSNIKESALSRGYLTKEYLESEVDPESYLNKIHQHRSSYNGFNLLLKHGNDFFHYSNYEGKINKLENGIYGLSNALLDTPWPKVKKIKEYLSELLNTEVAAESLFNMMTDETVAHDNELPDTGIAKDWERSLSPVCIRTEKYGTCSTTVILVNQKGRVEFQEKTYAIGDKKESLIKIQFNIGN